MGWLDTPERKRKQHVQVIAGGNIKDLDRIHERDRRRRINALLWFLFIISGLFGWIMFKAKYTEQSYYLFGLALIFLVIITLKYGLHRRIKLGRRNKDGWEKLKFAPDWVYKKMKRQRIHRVNGDYYIYKKEENNFYRKKK